MYTDLLISCWLNNSSKLSSLFFIPRRRNYKKRPAFISIRCFPRWCTWPSPLLDALAFFRPPTTNFLSRNNYHAQSLPTSFFLHFSCCNFSPFSPEYSLHFTSSLQFLSRTLFEKLRNQLTLSVGNFSYSHFPANTKLSTMVD